LCLSFRFSVMLTIFIEWFYASILICLTLIDCIYWTHIMCILFSFSLRTSLTGKYCYPIVQMRELSNLPKVMQCLDQWAKVSSSLYSPKHEFLALSTSWDLLETLPEAGAINNCPRQLPEHPLLGPGSCWQLAFRCSDSQKPAHFWNWSHVSKQIRIYSPIKLWALPALNGRWAAL
jgi:hypothetical protein